MPHQPNHAIACIEFCANDYKSICPYSYLKHRKTINTLKKCNNYKYSLYSFYSDLIGRYLYTLMGPHLFYNIVPSTCYGTSRFHPCLPYILFTLSSFRVPNSVVRFRFFFSFLCYLSFTVLTCPVSVTSRRSEWAAVPYLQIKIYTLSCKNI